MLGNAVARHAGRGRGMAFRTWHAGQRCGMSCWPRPLHGMLAKAKAWHAGQRYGMACGPESWHGMPAKAVAWHVGQGYSMPRCVTQWRGMLGNAVARHAGQGRGMAETVPWHSDLGMLGNAVACHAGRGRGMACWPRLRRGTLGNAVAWHAGPRRGKACGPRLWHGMLAEAVAWLAGRGRGMAFQPWHAGQRCGMACVSRPWHGMLAKAKGWHAGQRGGMACWATSMDFIPGIDGPSEGVPRVLACFSNFGFQKIVVSGVFSLSEENLGRANGHIFNVSNRNNEVTIRQLTEMMTQVSNSSFNLLIPIMSRFDTSFNEYNSNCAVESYISYYSNLIPYGSLPYTMSYCES
ncbi:hypothetical protein TEA_028897 [Camellia sinensis var. sinensis]|uniref:Uncharacterized protein n=1 Tax=Camellia sinensis var. sinensis TaxID=542762 RepID=A0A4S4DPE5_CAMSN|nr:hypothetical protein TEA_028897 [Camellia sinensis var. sinensis]